MSARTSKSPAGVLNPCRQGHHAGCKGHMAYTVRTDQGNPAKGIDPTYESRFEQCTCECHANGNPPRCKRCNSPEGELVAGYCVDTDACDVQLASSLDANPLWQGLQASLAAGREARRAANGAQGDADSPRAPRGQGNATKRATTGRCEHCGSPTKGGRFTVGHDAKLKGELKRAAEAGELDALIELHLREWPTHTAKVAPEFAQEAELAANAVGATWLADRVAARMPTDG